ncbi:hypothetical protein GGF31_003078 [Allomyces arbusculus]|nr:hypothetical protein GGF31_003078 [Allomyces arbusculus]
MSLQSRQVTVVWVRPTNATARAAVPMAQFGQPVSRQAANAILQAMIKNKLLDETAWVRVVGALTEAEVMAMRFDDQCLGAGPGGETSARAAGFEPAVIRGTGLVGQYGVTAAVPFMNGYEIKCGLLPTDVDSWIKDRMVASPAFSVAPDLDPTANNLSASELPRSRASALQYLDFTQSSTIGRPGQESTAGAVVAILASLNSNLTSKGEFEYLTFGALTSTSKTGLTTTSLVTVSDALVAASSKIPVDRLTTHMALTSVDQTCTPSSVPVGTFDLNKAIDVTQHASASGYMVASSSRPFAWAARRIDAELSHCRINMKGFGSNRRGSDGTNLTQTAAEVMHQSSSI